MRYIEGTNRNQTILLQKLSTITFKKITLFVLLMLM
jgi:hypothetical protein